MTREYICGMAPLLDCVGGLIGFGVVAALFAGVALFALWDWWTRWRK